MKPIAKSLGRQKYVYMFPVRMVETRKCVIVIAFQLCFRMCHEEGISRLGGLEINWYTSPSIL